VSPRPVTVRRELALTYAGIAALTALLLGGLLLGVLASYYRHAEAAFLDAAAQRVLMQPLASTDSQGLAVWAARSAVVAQTRIRVFSAEGTLLADSGPLDALDPGELDVGGRRPGMLGRRMGRLPAPLGGERSTSVAAVRVALPDGMLGAGAYFTLSEPPVSGADVLPSIARAWLVAALLAVALSALAGYVLSRRISRPLAALTDASDRMAEGDLSARAPVEGADEFGRLATSFNTMADRIEATVVSLRRFVADAAHEIGTPLTALEADLELAQGAEAQEDERRLVDRALGQARRLEALSQSLLRLSRIESGDAAQVEPVDVGNLVREAVDAIASRAEQAEVELAADVVADPLVSLADTAKLQIVFDALLDNAVKFTPAGGSIDVTAIRSGGDALVVVTDTGIGIPLAEQDEVFSRFHRGRNVASIPGNGLGLAIVKATVERFGGTVAFESGAGGTRVDVRLPLAPDASGA
jgi:signal transduction histidine kinase